MINLMARLLKSPEERETEALARVVADMRRRAEEAREQGCRFQQDNMTRSANEAFATWRFYREVADRLDGSYSPNKYTPSAAQILRGEGEP